ncbi:hypothetical protein PoB_000275500 [Plakobranchus ocellatus]|uniref:IgGFc-binding protein N-terminal domain-containing protein n=1 Tax=Plakobranchus ocellatus TaxID=259542 RepID=A0AAV3XZI4_9GAST|nr:hypothetical protein PoB_000275500 [Plakobranchus ocellatus]
MKNAIEDDDDDDYDDDDDDDDNDINIMHGQDFMMRIPERYAKTCDFTLDIISVVENTPVTQVVFTQLQGQSNSQAMLSTRNFKLEATLSHASYNPLVTLTSVQDVSVTLRVVCKQESGEVSHYALSRAIPTPYWGVEYVLVFPHELQCATVILLCKEAATVQLDLQGCKTDPNSVVVLEDGTVLETFAVYSLSLAARERYQITALNWDLTGSKLTGNQRFSVVVGPRNIETSFASCTNEPFAMEQLMPTFSWGSEYIIPTYEYYLVTIRLVTLEEENTVDYGATINFSGAVVFSASDVLATIGEDLTYTLTDHMTFDVIRSTKPLMVVVTYGSPELEDIAFTQITPLSHFPDRAMITLTESSLFEIVIAFNVGCLFEFSDHLYDFTIESPVGLTRHMISFFKDPPVSASAVDSFSVSTYSPCSGLLALVLASLPGGPKPALAANPAGWTLCPEGQIMDVHNCTCGPDSSGQSSYSSTSGIESTTSKLSSIESPTSNASVVQNKASDASVVQSTTPSASGFENKVPTASVVHSTTSNAPIVQSTASNASAVQSTTPNASLVETTTSNVPDFESTKSIDNGLRQETKSSVSDTSYQYKPTDSNPNQETTTALHESLSPSPKSAHKSTTSDLYSQRETTTLDHTLLSGKYSTSPEGGNRATTPILQSPKNASIQCPCRCSSLQNITYTEQLRIAKLKAKLYEQILQVKTAELSKTKQKSECATDERPSSTTVGYFGVAFLVSVFGSIVCADLLNFLANRKR